MSKELLIDASHPEETRIAIKSDRGIEEYEYENIHRKNLKGNIYLGKVSRIEPSLQAAFVDFGNERHGFLAFNDIQSDYYQIPQADKDRIKKEEEEARAKRVHGVKGIHNAHIEAAKLSETHMFWVVDGDAELVEDFNFSHSVSRYEKNIVHVWKSKNPINDLIYGYGGVKLLPRELTLKMDVNTPDMTTSISKQFKAMPSVSNITKFNTDEFSTWRSAFRECVKLSSKVIERQDNDETLSRLNTWCTSGKDKPFGEYAIRGALAGKAYGEQHKGNPSMLQLINNFDWLKEQYEI